MNTKKTIYLIIKAVMLLLTSSILTNPRRTGYEDKAEELYNELENVSYDYKDTGDECLW